MRPHRTSLTNYGRLTRVMSDVCGPFTTKTLKGERYFISFTDMGTRYVRHSIVI